MQVRNTYQSIYFATLNFQVSQVETRGFRLKVFFIRTVLNQRIRAFSYRKPHVKAETVLIRSGAD